MDPAVRQPTLFDRPDRSDQVRAAILHIFEENRQPSAAELLEIIEKRLGADARWSLVETAEALSESLDLLGTHRRYLRSLLESGDLADALRGENVTSKEVNSSIDLLLHQSSRYGTSKAFQEMIDFMGRFRDYSPFNNMLVHIQNPSCSFYATERDWHERFRRKLKEDPRPMLILAPMHPVMLVYDLDQTEGPELPQEMTSFGLFGGDFKQKWLTHLLENAAGHRIDIAFKHLSSTNAGFATLARDYGPWKMRVAIHDELDSPSRFGVLCHELAHILLGHLGSDFDYWWPARTNLSRQCVEIEAEAVAWIVTRHLGLEGSSSAYISRHLGNGRLPPGVSLDMIAKTASHLEHMATEHLPPRNPRAPISKFKTNSAR